ncbi:MAG: hypothetical protein WBH21_11040 [Vibrio anguillarum]
MKLELPDNNASVLFHMGNALQSIARDIDTSLPVNDHKVTHTKTVEPLMVMATGDKNPINTDTSERRHLDETELSDSIDELAESVGLVRQQASDVTVEVSDTIDADGLPWDQRIHSRNKTRLADDTWRLARKPNDKSDEEWSEYVEEVKAELKALMEIPVVEAPTVEAPVAIDANGVEFIQLPGEIHEVEINGTIVFEGMTPDGSVAVAPAPSTLGEPVAPTVTPPVVEAPTVTPPVVEAPTVTPPVVEAPTVTPPVVEAPTVTPPVVDDHKMTFGELMRWITSNSKVLTKESIDEVLKAQGIASIALLATRAALIPQVHAELSKLV